MLDKKALRKYAADNPAPAIPAGHGLLHAHQVGYIVRTAVKIIDRHRTLVLYVYDRAKAADGGTTPIWTMFHAGSDYITLAMEPEGKTSWRTARFENLGKDYRFTESCAFYTAEDERRVGRYFHDNRHKRFIPLISAQDAILSARLKEKTRRKEQKIQARMAGIPALPEGLVPWARCNVLPTYFIYRHARKGRAEGICSSCGEKVALSGVKRKNKAACPHCGREITMIPRGCIKYLHDQETGVVLQRMGAGLVVRILKIHAEYQDETPMIGIRENARQFASLGPDGAVEFGHYYLSNGGELTGWKEGTRPVYYYQPTYESITAGYLFCDNLPGALAGTPWEYCPIVPFYQSDSGPMDVLTFLWAYIKHPRYEHLIKMGFCQLVCQLVYHPYTCCPAPKLDETQNRTHRLLGVAAEDVGFLRDLNAGMKELQLLQAYHQDGVKDRQRLLRWQLDHNVTHDIDHILKHITPHKFMRYIDEQYAALRLGDAEERYSNVQSVVSEYRDYLDMCAKLGYDMDNSFVLYPKDLQKAHDEVQVRFKAEADAQMRRDFKAAMRAIAGHLDFEAGGMRIVLPEGPDDIIAEGQALHHCVGGYADRVAKHECIILFLRQCKDPDKPFFTVEVRGGKVVQVRGVRNRDATPEVEAFMSQWERQVLRARAAA